MATDNTEAKEALCAAHVDSAASLVLGSGCPPDWPAWLGVSTAPDGFQREPGCAGVGTGNEEAG